ncbi:Hypothetical protein IALB_3128 [Ignavibacterium album JCM 16511]|uniref:LysM domain-containing protein n=1 Tax=Ignavibacterium album (strain DSM 19864 / JCM 16511 / NBRC 101810 / Mat9-16) TaxID=945713 RepID=I0APC4_IGNAJ|nr:DUF5666 domain-containing protein [Ignavibacterium album]AFH50831.1 Hypothetical protein IALB_3128 [Ignavibacterium album JCM 16511]
MKKENFPGRSFSKHTKAVFIAILFLLSSANLFAEDLELTGNITQLGNDWLIVQGYTFYVDQNTELKGPNGNTVPFSFFQLNDLVQVKGNNRGDGTYLATRVKWEDNPNNPNEIELTGYVTAKNSNSFDINGTTFLVDANTIYRGRHGNPFSFDMIQVGMLLEVKAILQTGNLLATRVKTEDDHNNQHGNEIELKGFIDAKTSGSVIVGQREFSVNAQTVILNRNNSPISFSQLNVGDFVEIKAYRQPDSSFLAVRIKLEDTPQNQIELKAKIESIAGSEITIGGITFNTDSNTVFLDHNRMPITISFLSVGMLVEVKGFKRQDGTYYATKIKIEDFVNNEVEVRGTISDLGSSSLTVAGLTFDVDSSTQVFDHQNNPISYSSLQVGQLVEVKGLRTVSNSLKAIRIKVEQNEDIEIFGRITAVNSDNIEVNGLTIFVNANTVYLNHANLPITFSDLAVDQFVEVKMINLPDNSLLALKVKIEDSRNFSKVNGFVGIVNGNTIQLPSATYNITNQTIIIDLNFNFINANQITNGQQVIVWASASGSSNNTALQIRSMVASPNSVDESVTVANGYQLAQNYPNPFNPATKISFTIPVDQQVALKVYNSLGEEVATLINNSMSKGTHTINFDAKGLSSGLYFYRLESGNQVLVRKMMLLK